jgi:hypothetical protein
MTWESTSDSLSAGRPSAVQSSGVSDPWYTPSGNGVPAAASVVVDALDALDAEPAPAEDGGDAAVPASSPGESPQATTTRVNVAAAAARTIQPVADRPMRDILVAPHPAARRAEAGVC